MIPCPDCGKDCVAELLFGITNAMECDPRCEGAYGPQCSCACGGINHGGIWSERLDDIPLGYVLKYRADQEAKQRKRESKAANERIQREIEFTNWIQGNPDAFEIVKYAGDNNFILDLLQQMSDYNPLTPNQLSAGLKALKQEQEYEDAKAQAIKLAASSTYQGNEGDKLTRKLTITKIVHLTDNYARSYGSREIPTKPMYVLTDGTNVYVWYASSYQFDYTLKPDQSSFSGKDYEEMRWKVGDEFSLQFTVKTHKDYEGVKQTIINRAKAV